MPKRKEKAKDKLEEVIDMDIDAVLPEIKEEKDGKLFKDD